LNREKGGSSRPHCPQLARSRANHLTSRIPDARSHTGMQSLLIKPPAKKKTRARRTRDGSEGAGGGGGSDYLDGPGEGEGGSGDGGHRVLLGEAAGTKRVRATGPGGGWLARARQAAAAAG
jgi:hypothetical protein